MRTIHIRHIIPLLLLPLALISCKETRRKADISGIDLEIRIGRFDQRFWTLDTNDLPRSVAALKADFPGMTEIYLQHVVQFGHPDSAETWDIYRNFRRDTSVRRIYTDALERFADVSSFEKELTLAFRRARYFFPDNSIPHIYMHVSGFNQSVIVGDGFMSLSEDNYMGSDYPVYDLAMIYGYQKLNMRPEKIVPDFMTVWLSSEFPMGQQDYSAPRRLIDDIIYHGKTMYMLTLLLPDTDEKTLMGYTDEQWQWAADNEPNMWASLISTGDLFTQDVIRRNQYVNDGPFTLPFTQESSPRGGTFIGWKIIEAYMRNHQEITPLQLMHDNDAQRILEDSGYNPR